MRCGTARVFRLANMGYIEYIELLLGAPWLYIAALFIAFPVYILMLRKQIDTIFDPLALNMFSAAIGTATVVFLFFTENIATKYFVQYSLSELCYLTCLTIIPLRLGKVLPPDELLGDQLSRRRFQCIYLVSAVIFLVAQPLIYIQNGIPLFYESRLDYYAAGNGIGIFSRILEVSSYLCWYLLLHKYTYKWHIRFVPRLFDALLLLGLIASCVLSGSKSELLVIIFLIFYFRALHRKSKFYPHSADRMLRMVQRSTFAVAFFVALVVLSVTKLAANIGGSLSALLLRIVSAGDVYFMAYPGSNLHDLDASHPLLAVFGPTLALFRLVDPSSLGTALGFQIFHNVVGSTADLGPNPRHNIFGLVYFGFLGSLIYSSMLGLLVCLARNRWCKYIHLGGVSELLYVFVLLHVVDVNVDVQSLIASIDSLVIVAPWILLAAYILDIGTSLGMDNLVRAHPAGQS